MHLPKPIDIYIRAENAGDPTALSDCFAPDATVRDEGRVHQGLAAIQQWQLETKRKYNAFMEPLRSVERDGRTFVTARVAGNFPGSPIEMDFSFLLEGERIRSLAIG